MHKSRPVQDVSLSALRNLGLVEDKFLLPGSEAPQHGVKDKTFLLLKTALQTKISPSRDVHGGAWSALGLSGVDFFTKGDFLS